MPGGATSSCRSQDDVGGYESGPGTGPPAPIGRLRSTPALCRATSDGRVALTAWCDATARPRIHP